MSAFADTSILYALLDGSLAEHARAREAIRTIGAQMDLVTSNYVVVETASLAQRRLGPNAVRVLLDDIVGALHVVWVDGAVHEEAALAMRTAGRRAPSLVDRVSFAVMRRRGIDLALSLDRHFAQAGFRVAPA